MPGCPTWANEGLAEVVAGEITVPGGILEGRLTNLEDAIAQRAVPKVNDLVHMGPTQFYGANSAVHYAMAWSLCRYLARGTPPGGAGAAFQAFLAKLREGERPEKAFSDAFEKVDMTALDASWRKYVASLRRSRVPQDR